MAADGTGNPKSGYRNPQAYRGRQAPDSEHGSRRIGLSGVTTTDSEGLRASTAGTTQKQVPPTSCVASLALTPILCLLGARQFLSNAGRRLTPQEMQKLAPQAQRYLSQFASSLDDAIRLTADDAGVLDDYTNAVDEYRKAMKLNDAWEAIKGMGKGMVSRTIQNIP